MALHPDITRKDDVSLALETAAGAMLLATRQQTSNAGSVTIPNADGTKTVMGADAGDTTVAKFVGDTTAPGKPTGITAISRMRTVFVSWDGTLDGGVPKDFLLVRLHLSYAGEDGAAVESDLGDLYGPGGAASANLPEGTVVTVTARAYDDAHDDHGASASNVSASCDPITVTVVDDAAELQRKVEADIKVVSDKADKAQGVADNAADANTKLREDTAKSLETVNTAVAGVRTDVDAVSNKATTLASGLDSANTKITSTSDKLTGLTTTVSNVSKTADDSMALSTTNHQDLAGFQTKVQQTYSTKEETLNQVNIVTQKADALSATLSKDYQKTADSDAKYSTKAELTATSKSITASVAETYATKSVVDALKNIADKAIETWQGPGEPTLTNLPASDWTTADLKKQHSGDVYYDTDSGFAYRFGSADGTTYKWGRISDSDITKALNLASKAQETADGAVAGVTKLNTDIPLTYATKSEVKVTTDGIKADVVEAKRIGQTGVDNAAALAIRADGIDATLSQQATNIDKNVKSITQLGLRADGISTSVSQVDAKTDQALANAQELVINGGFETGVLAPWTLQNADGLGVSKNKNGSHTGDWRLAGNLNYQGTGSIVILSNAFSVVEGRTYRMSVWAWFDLASQYANISLLFDSGQSIVTILNVGGGFTNTYADIVAPKGVSTAQVRIVLTPTASKPFVRFDDISCRDITESAAAQKDATSALSQYTTLSQDLTGFKTQVTQTYETKDASTAKATTAQQNLQGFKNTVQNDYLSKTDAGTTYSTKTETAQTAEALTTKITTVGTDAQSALTRITTAEQDVKGFKNTVSATYATKTALDTTNGNVTQAQKDATTALSQYTTLSQDVNGFKQTVDQKYETKEDSQSKNTTLSQDLAGFKTSVSQTYTKQTDFNTLSNKASQSFQFSTPGNTNNYWYRLGILNNGVQGKTFCIDILANAGQNGNASQNVRATITIVPGWTGGGIAKAFGVAVTRENWQTLQVMVMATDQYTCEVWVLNNVAGFFNGTYTISGYWAKWTDSPANQTAVPSTGTSQDVAYRLNPEQLQSDVAATYASKTSVEQTATQITSQVETKYATKDALSQTDSKVDQKADEWSVQLSTISSRADAITSTTDDLSDQLATTNSNVDNINGTLSEEIARRQAYMRFSQEADGDPALELGASSSPNKVVLTNDRLSFKSNDAEVAYVGNDQMNINNANVTRTLRIGNFMFAPRADGHLTLTRV